jgi:hypothetical protein
MGRLNYVGKQIASAINLASAYTSDAIDVRHLINAGFTCVCTGSPTGTFEIQKSHDGQTWQVLLDGTGAEVQLTLSGSAENLQFDLTDFSYGYFRLVYAAGGTGAADIYYQAKSVG